MQFNHTVIEQMQLSLKRKYALNASRRETKRACAHQEAEDRGHWVKRCHLLLGKVCQGCGQCSPCAWGGSSGWHHRARIPLQQYPKAVRETENSTLGWTFTPAALRSHTEEEHLFVSRRLPSTLAPETDRPTGCRGMSTATTTWPPSSLPKECRISHNIVVVCLLNYYSRCCVWDTAANFMMQTQQLHQKDVQIALRGR